MAEALNGLSTLSAEELEILFSSLTEQYTPIEINEHVYMIPSAVNDLIDNLACQIEKYESGGIEGTS